MSDHNWIPLVYTRDRLYKDIHGGAVIADSRAVICSNCKASGFKSFINDGSVVMIFSLQNFTCDELVIKSIIE